MSGRLVLTGVSNGTVTLQYTPAATFASGTLYWYQNSTGVTASQAVVSGSNTITGIPNGAKVIVYVSALDATPEFLGTTAPISLITSRVYTNDPKIHFRWRTNETDWQSAEVSANFERMAYPVDMRGFWYQQELSCRAQNQRHVFSMEKLQTRIHGRGEEAVS